MRRLLRATAHFALGLFLFAGSFGCDDPPPPPPGGLSINLSPANGDRVRLRIGEVFYCSAYFLPQADAATYIIESPTYTWDTQRLIRFNEPIAAWSADVVALTELDVDGAWHHEWFAETNYPSYASQAASAWFNTIPRKKPDDPRPPSDPEPPDGCPGPQAAPDQQDTQEPACPELMPTQVATASATSGDLVKKARASYPPTYDGMRDYILSSPPQTLAMALRSSSYVQSLRQWAARQGLSSRQIDDLIALAQRRARSSSASADFVNFRGYVSLNSVGTYTTQGERSASAKAAGRPGAADFTPEQGPEAVAAVQHVNYPNPFKSATTIEYRLAEAAQVTLKVFDATGREIDELVDAYQEARVYRVAWDMSAELPSGVYFYELEVNGQIHSSLMTLVK